MRRKSTVERLALQGARADASDAADPVSRRVGRLARWARVGRQADAELELYAWHRQGDAPAAASVTLAALLARRQAWQEALDVLEEVDADASHRRDLLQLSLLSLDQTAERPGAVEQIGERTGAEPRVRRRLAMLGYPVSEPESAGTVVGGWSAKLVDQLAAEPRLIPALVASAKQSGEHVALLRQVIGGAADRIADPQQFVGACKAMTDLAMIASDDQDARRWAHKGLEINPYHAHLALVLAQLKDSAGRPAATTVLARVVNRHPKYPDVQAALIRRTAADGDVTEAKTRLERWRQRDPDHHLVARIQRELAA